MSLPQWDSVRLFNKETGLSPNDCKFVVLIHKTNSFQVEIDLKKTLKITKRPLKDFIEAFKQHRVRVEYATLFLPADLKTLGPIADQQTCGIVSTLLNKLYCVSKPTLVATPGCIRNVWSGRNPFPTMSFETFRNYIFADKKSS